MGVFQADEHVPEALVRAPQCGRARQNPDHPFWIRYLFKNAKMRNVSSQNCN